MKAVLAANRAPADVDALAAQAATWLDTLTPDGRLRLSGLLSSKFQWLSIEAQSPLRPD